MGIRGSAVPAGIGALVMRDGRPHQSDDYATETTIRHDPVTTAAAAEEGIVSVLAVPIQSGGANIGFLWVSTRRRRRFTAEDTSLLERFAVQAAVAIDNARSHARERSARAEVEALLAATATLAAQLEPDDVLRALVEQATALLDAEAGAYAVLRDGRVVSDVDDAVLRADLHRQRWIELLGVTSVTGKVVRRAALCDGICREAGRPDRRGADPRGREPAPEAGSARADPARYQDLIGVAGRGAPAQGSG